MDCDWTNNQKALFFDTFIFLSKVPNLRVTLDSREMMLSYKHSHTHINYFESFDSVISHLSYFLKDFKEFNNEMHTFYVHEKITSKEFHKIMEERFKNGAETSVSYVPQKDVDHYHNTIDALISGYFFKE